MRVRIEATDLPGRTCLGHGNVHVGVQKGSDVVDLVPGDAAEASWSFDVDVRDGDPRGAYVHGRRGDRFLYLSWGEVAPDGTFTMFRRLKLKLEPGRTAPLTVRIGLTACDGTPLCGSVHVA